METGESVDAGQLRPRLASSPPADEEMWPLLTAADTLRPADGGSHRHNVAAAATTAAAADPLRPADSGSHRRYVAVVSGPHYW